MSGQDPGLKSLSDQLESAIRGNVNAQVEAALKAARATALNAYSQAFRDVCGLRFAMVVSRALMEAEELMADAAKETAMRRELDSVIKRMVDESSGVRIGGHRHTGVPNG